MLLWRRLGPLLFSWHPRAMVMWARAVKLKGGCVVGWDGMMWGIESGEWEGAWVQCGAVW